MFTEADVAEVRHVAQRILVPFIFVIGLLGNSVSIYVLTRKRMRCTTNIYLTALAITDIIYLTMGLLLSLKHYEYIQLHCELYWMFYGIVVWLCDACAYISIYIAVCFTIERFIAIRYPLKRQTFCTESLAKKVIAGVTLFCILSTISTAFEHQYRIDSRLIDSHGKPCNLTQLDASRTLQKKWPANSDGMASWYANDAGIGGDGGSGSGLDEQDLPEGKSVVAANAFSESKRLTLRWDALTTPETTQMKEAASNIPSITPAYFALHSLRSELTTARADFPANQAGAADLEAALLHMQMERYLEQQHDSLTHNATLSCRNVTFYLNTPSRLAQDALYTRIWGFFTLFVFVLIPLCVLGTFNCFLIMLVRRSKNLRGEMTNASSMRRHKRKSQHSSVSQENRVTVTLIAVVLLFIVCQLPWAIYLIVSEHMEIDRNLQLIIGNIFNCLAAINAAANFFLYCVLSDKYRKTVRELITGYRYRKQRSMHTNASLYTSTPSNGSRRYRSAGTSVIIK